MGTRLPKSQRKLNYEKQRSMRLKKVLSFILIIIAASLLTGGFFILKRFVQNPQSLIPYPYGFKAPAEGIQVEAPILIVGDRMGVYFAKFQTELAATISVNLASPIKIKSLAQEGHALHRTLHELKAIVDWPQVLIYQGASEEFRESKFDPTETKHIKLNFTRYQDEKLSTAMMLYPWLSRIVYEPMKRVKLGESPVLLEEISEADYLKRLETEFLLFEQQLIQLVQLAQEKKSLLILTTTPFNLDIPPKRV
jgi:hypothetical protein